MINVNNNFSIVKKADNNSQFDTLQNILNDNKIYANFFSKQMHYRYEIDI